MSETQHDHDSPIRSLDRLAAGDLDAQARRELFAWLDREPSRWRRCALTLLEAREWEQALGDWRAECPSNRRTDVARLLDDGLRLKSGDSGRTPPRNGAAQVWESSPRFPSPAVRPIPPAGRWGERLAVAATVLVAFGLGIAVRGIGTGPQREVVQAPRDSDNGRPSPYLQRAPTDGSADRGHDTLTDQVVSQPNGHDDAPSVAAHPSPSKSAEPIPAYVRSQLERRGYRVDSRHTVVPVALPDGRRVMLPVDQLQFSYIGQRSY
jgi:hypothetical protein